MDIKPIRTEADYDWALQEIEAYFENEPSKGSPEADRFDVLASLIEAYEDKHWTIKSPDPVEAIQYALELRGEQQSYLAQVLGSRSRASEILNRNRSLSLAMIQKISTELMIPAEILIQPYHLSGK